MNNLAVKEQVLGGVVTSNMLAAMIEEYGFPVGGTRKDEDILSVMNRVGGNRALSALILGIRTSTLLRRIRNNPDLRAEVLRRYDNPSSHTYINPKITREDLEAALGEEKPVVAVCRELLCTDLYLTKQFDMVK